MCGAMQMRLVHLLMTRRQLQASVGRRNDLAMSFSLSLSLLLSFCIFSIVCMFVCLFVCLFVCFSLLCKVWFAGHMAWMYLYYSREYYLAND